MASTSVRELGKLYDEAADSTKYVKKGTKNMLKGMVESLKRYATGKETTDLDNIITIIDSPTINVDQRKQLRKYKRPVAKMITKYAEEFEEELNEDDIEKATTVEEAQGILDAKIPKYNRYTQQNPMMGITWDKTNKAYKIVYKNVNSQNKNLEAACTRVRDIIIANTDKPDITSDYQASVIKNSGCTLIKYLFEEEEYYDILHVIANLSLKNSSSSTKYLQFKANACAVIAHKNAFGGYIFRELIDITTVREIIGSSFSQSIIDMMKLLGIDRIDCRVIHKETRFINSIMRAFSNETMVTQKSVSNKYRIDLFFPDYYLAVECDEFGHSDRDQANEIVRQNHIEDELGVVFLRFNPDDPNFDIMDIVSIIHSHITETVQSRVAD